MRVPRCYFQQGDSLQHLEPSDRLTQRAPVPARLGVMDVGLCIAVPKWEPAFCIANSKRIVYKFIMVVPKRRALHLLG
jgi:hypothetical protein